MISLSKNILCEIFSYLKPTEICTVSRTCKRLNELCESDILWQASVDPGSGSQRKSIFCHRGRVTYNIFNKLKQTCILSGHVSTIKTIFIKRNKVLTCSDDESVRLWDIKKLRGNKIIQHTGSVACAQFWDKGIVSVSSDRTMKIYQKGKEIKSEYAHRSGINHLKEINGTKFITGGHDGAVKIWDLNEGKALITHQDFDRDISRVEVAQNYYCYTASLHNQIYLRNLDRPDILQEFEYFYQQRPGRNNPALGSVCSLMLNYPLLFSGETDSVKIWDLRTDDPVVNIPMDILGFNYRNKGGIFKMLLNDPNKLLIGSYGLTGIVEYDLRNLENNYYPVHDYQILSLCKGQGVLNNLVVTSGATRTFNYELNVYKTQELTKSVKFIPGHKGVINTIDIGDSSIASGGKDGSVRVLTFDKSKETLRTTGKIINISSS